MLEYLCGGTLVLNGSWLNYSELDDIDVEHIRFDNFDELSTKLVECIYNIKCNDDNANQIWTFMSWNERVCKWNALYS